MVSDNLTRERLELGLYVISSSSALFDLFGNGKVSGYIEHFHALETVVRSHYSSEEWAALDASCVLPEDIAEEYKRFEHYYQEKAKAGNILDGLDCYEQFLAGMVRHHGAVHKHVVSEVGDDPEELLKYAGPVRAVSEAYKNALERLHGFFPWLKK